MPARPGRPCAHPGCSAIVRGGSRCNAHRLPPRPDQRPSAARRGYDSEWQRKRKMYLTAHPWCVDPFDIHFDLVAAVVVDHIVPLSQGGKDDETNYQSLCRTCNNKKTARDGSRGYQGRG